MIQNYNIKSTDNIFSSFQLFNNMEQSVSAKKIQQKQDKFESQYNEDIKKTLLGKSVESSILLAGILGLLLIKGYHGSAISTISEKLSEVSLIAQKGSDKTFSKLQASSNFTALKDVFFDKVFRLTSFTAKYADFAKKFEKKVIDGTLNKLYDKVCIKISSMTSLIQKFTSKNLQSLNQNQEIEIKGVKKALAEWYKILNEEATNLQTHFNDGFSLGVRTTRSAQRDENLKDTIQKIDETFFQDGGLFKKENYETYVTEKVTRKTQKQLKEQIVSARKKVTNNITHIYNAINECISKLKISIDVKDKEVLEILTNVEKELEKFNNCCGTHENETRNLSSLTIIALLRKMETKIIDTTKYSPKEKEKILENIGATGELIFSANETTKGSLEKIMTILKGLNGAKVENGTKKIISDEEYKKYKEMADNISKDLNKATNQEMGEYFLKQAEISAGSAATDIFTLLFPFTAGAYAVSKCENSDERISTALKTCIPLVGSFGTLVYGTVKMLSGAKNILFSIGSGLVLNVFGTYLDDTYQDLKKSGFFTKTAQKVDKNVSKN